LRDLVDVIWPGASRAEHLAVRPATIREELTAIVFVAIREHELLKRHHALNVAQTKLSVKCDNIPVTKLVDKL
jgi:hypothetical protein